MLCGTLQTSCAQDVNNIGNLFCNNTRERLVNIEFHKIVNSWVQIEILLCQLMRSANYLMRSVSYLMRLARYLEVSQLLDEVGLYLVRSLQLLDKLAS